MLRFHDSSAPFPTDLSIVSWPIQEEATNSFHSIKYDDNFESKIIFASPFEGAMKWSEKDVRIPD